jgi:hypothetical protein
MFQGSRKYFTLSVLFAFLFLTLFINFFHTEKTLEENDNCPACHFQNSSLATCHINFFHLPPPSILGVLKFIKTLNYSFTYTIEPTSRSPPQA